MERKRPRDDDHEDRPRSSRRRDRSTDQQEDPDDPNNDQDRPAQSPLAGPSRIPPRGQRSRDSTSPEIQSRLLQMAATSTVDCQAPFPSSSRGHPLEGAGAGAGGRRARRPRPTDAQLADFVRTRADDCNKTVPPADPDKRVELIANYFRVEKRNEWVLLRYHVDFDPPIERTHEKRIYMRPHLAQFGWNVFDGSALYTVRRIPTDRMELYSARDGSDERIAIIIRPDPVVIPPTDPSTIQIYNILMRECLRALGLQQIGRYYYDSSSSRTIDGRIRVGNLSQRLDVWQGYKTTFRQHERDLLLCVDITNKVLHLDTIYDFIYKEEAHDRDRDTIKNMLVGETVMTVYNSRTYRIDDVDWTQSPLTTFDHNGTQKSFAQYISGKYHVDTHNDNQPILYSNPTRRDRARGLREPIALIPEFCRMTGLTKSQRENGQLMANIAKILQLKPEPRINRIREFSRKLQQNNINDNILAPAGLRISNDLIRLDGKFLPLEKINFVQNQNGENQYVIPRRDKYDWSADLMRSQMSKTVDLKNWSMVTDDVTGTQGFVDLLIQRARNMGLRINQPNQKLVAQLRNVPSYLSKIDEIMTTRPDSQLILCFISDESHYGEIKRKCYMDHGVASQCIRMAKVKDARVVGGVASKVAIQINAKLGGVPWTIHVPLKKFPLMVVGYNVSTLARRSTGGETYGALVATMNNDQSKFYSLPTRQQRGQNLSTVFRPKMKILLDAYKRNNGSNLPAVIVFYRDGVGEGQLQSVVDVEVEQIEGAIKDVYGENYVEGKNPYFAFVVVSKRTNTKLFTPPNERSREHENPLPGTVVDDVITLPERYDFYLLSQKGTGQGTISPTCYNVIHDRIKDKLDPERMQQLTHKLTHLYYNWSGPVPIPSVCLYASKLAFLVGTMNRQGGDMDREPQAQLASTLYYL